MAFPVFWLFIILVPVIALILYAIFFELEERSSKRLPCPSCGTFISKDDMYCRKCGAPLPEVIPSPPEVLPKEVYERKFSLPQRFYKLLTAPSKTMRDIALAPDYEGVLVVIALQIVFLSVTSGLILLKIQVSGPHAGTISAMVSELLIGATVIAGILEIARWAIKSLIVRYACDSGSGWDFKTAASITGYAYIADIVVGIIGICIGWFLLPTLRLDSTDFEAMRQAFNDYEAQVDWLILVYTLPISFLGLLWKSYLGGLGAHFGTKEKCSLGMGIAVFFVLSLIGFLIPFII